MIDQNYWADPFLDAPATASLDGGTTSSGDLWHAIPPRWGHAMNSMCSYHGMFPARVAHYFIERYSSPDEVVLDPFSGRGTTPLQARVSGRRAIANDLSPLGYVLSAAKVNPPTWEEINLFIDGIEAEYFSSPQGEVVSEDIKMLFHPETLNQIVHLRQRLLGRPLVDWTPAELMAAGSLVGIIHGSTRRDGSSQYLSVSMPNTFSMSPQYVRKYIAENGLVAPRQNLFDRLREKISRLYADAVPGHAGVAFNMDANSLLYGDVISEGSVNLIVTSPPYLKVVNYAAANWIRLWFLGVEDVSTDQGAGRLKMNSQLDHGHAFSAYSSFMRRVFTGMARVLSDGGVAAVVIGDVADPGKDPVPLARKVWEEAGLGTGLELFDFIEDDLPSQKKVSRIWGDTKGRATDKDCVLLLRREGSGRSRSLGHAVRWEEPYKDAGPDAAHDRLRRVGAARVSAGQ